MESHEPPTEDVISLRSVGKSNEDITSELTQKGFTNQQVSEAINQADIKGGVEGSVPQPPPLPSGPPGAEATPVPLKTANLHFILTLTL